VVAALLQALHDDALPLAALDAQGVLLWCNARFAGLLGPATAPGQRLDQWLGAHDTRRLLAGEALERCPPGAPAAPAAPADETRAARWRWQATAPAGNGLHLLRAEPVEELQALRQRVAWLQERLELVQSFSQTGIFERDASTLHGSWDHHMYSIWGMPERPPEALAPSRNELTPHMLRDDLSDEPFERTLSRPGSHAQRIRIRRPDGQLRHLHTRWRVFHDAQGQPLRVLGTNTDDTEVYQQANRAEQLRTELEAALALGHIGLWRQPLGGDRLMLDRRGREIIGGPYD
jgi:PAS domain-containing protein